MSAAAPDWLAAALTCLARGVPCTLVTVAAVEGSAPREAGTKMLVHLDGMAGSVGGGHLDVADLAVSVGGRHQRLRTTPLSASAR
jgi:xanthine/CO dehydrogenase XdhC/CoxF family maturation factor